MSAVTIRPVRSKRDEKIFIKFQWNPYEGNPYWVPPLLMDRRKLIDRKNNPFYQHARMELFLAERDGQVVGASARSSTTTTTANTTRISGSSGSSRCSRIRRRPARCSTPRRSGWRTGRDSDAGPGKPVGER